MPALGLSRSEEKRTMIGRGGQLSMLADFTDVLDLSDESPFCCSHCIV